LVVFAVVPVLILVPVTVVATIAVADIDYDDVPLSV
jgi:hypothetical protein